MRSPYLCLLTVGLLGIALMTCLVGIILLELHELRAPPSLVAISGASVGALAAYLAQVQEPKYPPPL